MCVLTCMVWNDMRLWHNFFAFTSWKIACVERRRTGFAEIFRCFGERQRFVGPCGAMVARLTPDQKVACSNHVKVSQVFPECEDHRLWLSLHRKIFSCSWVSPDIKAHDSWRVSSELLRVSVNTVDNWSAQRFRVDGGTQFGPAALRGSCVLESLFTSLSSMERGVNCWALLSGRGDGGAASVDRLGWGAGPAGPFHCFLKATGVNTLDRCES